VIACDVIVRAFHTDSEIPLGVVTSLVGAPLFLQLLHRMRKEARDA
jgi:ABC-type Fe3+-siderophore transport system permease subunit